MRQALTLFVSTFSTLLAIVNPLEALPVFLKLLEGESLIDTLKVVSQCPLWVVSGHFGVPLSLSAPESGHRWRVWNIRLGPKASINWPAIKILAQFLIAAT
jgi:hypothetical protein